MNTVDDLRRTLEQHTGLAPDATGMLEQARAGAGRIRLRRRVATGMAAAAVAALVAIGAPLVAHRETLPAGPGSGRASSDMSISLAADSGFTLEQRAVDGARQLLVTLDKTNTPTNTARNEVWAYDPGAFDPSVLPAGETVRVDGHDALLVPALSRERVDLLKSMGGFPSGPQPSVTPDGTVNTAVEAAVVWQDPSGLWITVSKVQNRSDLLALAGAVRVGEPAPPLGPVGLSWLPSGVVVTHAETMELPAYSADIVLTPAKPGSNAVPAASAASHGPGETRVEIQVSRVDAPDWNDGLKLPASTFTVAGYPAWYSEGEVPGYSFGPTEARLLIKTDTCGIKVTSEDFTKITGADLKQMMNLAGYGSCTSKRDWIPVVS